MTTLTMGDWARFSEDEVWAQLTKPYGGWEDSARITLARPHYEILVAYQQENDYDGSAYLLLRHKESGELYEVESSHCSCYGHSWDVPGRVTKKYLLHRLNAGMAFRLPFAWDYDSEKPAHLAFRAFVEAL